MEILLAFAADLLLGDPPWFPHPVVLVGKLIERLEARLRKPGLSDRALIWRGAALAAAVVTITVAVTWGAVRLAAALHPAAGFMVNVALLYTTLAVKSLAGAARKVARPLAAGDLPAARQAVAMVVGRDTDNLDETGVARAAVETVAENTVDGITAPLFYALVGGAPLAMAYKAVNTMDSMLGYKNDRYLYFGRWAAKMDDAANWLPARLTVPVMLAAAAFLKMDWRRALKTVLRDGKKHQSPNSGLPEAAVAGALGVVLGGENSYGGKVSVRPLLGDGRPVRKDDIEKSTELMFCTAVLFMLCGLLARALILFAAGVAL